MTPAIVITSKRDYSSARRLQKALAAALFVPAHWESAGAIGYRGLAACLRSLFAAKQDLMAFVAVGVIIRSLAPLLRDKRSEPSVSAVVGKNIIPLLGAGSADGLASAKRAAEVLGLNAIATTASTAEFGLDLENPPPGWRLLNPDAFKGFAAGLLAGKEVDVTKAPTWLKKQSSSLPTAKEKAPLRIIETTAPVSITDGLAYAPQKMALGVGCVRHCPPSELLEFVTSELQKHRIAREAVGGVFTTSIKADEKAIHKLAEELSVPLRLFAPSILRRQEVPSPSKAVLEAVGSSSVSEAAALAAVRAATQTKGNGELLVKKRSFKLATLAVATAPQPLAAEKIGTAAGSLNLIGLGSGGGRDLTFKAAEALASCEAVVGYRRYLEMAEPFIAAAETHPFELGEEKKRVGHALKLAKSGLKTALVCSGDPGVYAMASLVFEELGPERVYVKTFCGVTAMLAAAAASGALLGHDFAVISLSDLLTAEGVIFKRLKAALRADMAIALYNPTSENRKELYRRAVQTLLEARSPTTPVAVAKSLSRKGEEVTLTTLARLPRQKVDMETVILIGNSSSKMVGDRAYTPRGYSRRSEGYVLPQVEAVR